MRPATIPSRFAVAAATLAVAGALVAAPASAVARAHRAGSCANADLPPTASNLASVRKATLCLINAQRTSRGLRALRSNSHLRAAADRYAREMVAKDFFGHVSPSGSTVLQRIKNSAYLKPARSWAIGENLAWGTGTLATAAQTVRGWMSSPPHRRNMLDKGFREIGIGVALGAPGSNDPGATYATEFGRRSR
jgi:uncharacterized protein YkwD